MLEKLPEKLRKLREAKGKTLRDVAAEIGITGTAISSYEQGNKIPLLSNALKLAEYYGVSIEEMCDLPTKGEAKTQADVLRALVMLREKVEGTEVSTENVPFEQSPLCTPENYDPYTEGTITIKSTLTIWKYYAGHFMRDYEHLRALRESGALDQSFIDIWLEKQYSEAEKRQL